LRARRGDGDFAVERSRDAPEPLADKAPITNLGLAS